MYRYMPHYNSIVLPRYPGYVDSTQFLLKIHVPPREPATKDSKFSLKNAIYKIRRVARMISGLLQYYYIVVVEFIKYELVTFY
jgi:hypothetical protein